MAGGGGASGRSDRVLLDPGRDVRGELVFRIVSVPTPLTARGFAVFSFTPDNGKYPTFPDAPRPPPLAGVEASGLAKGLHRPPKPERRWGNEGSGLGEGGEVLKTFQPTQDSNFPLGPAPTYSAGDWGWGWGGGPTLRETTTSVFLEVSYPSFSHGISGPDA